MAATDPDTATKDAAEEKLEEPSKSSVIPTPNPPKDFKAVKRSDIPMEPIFQTKKNPTKEDLEKEKATQQNYVSDLFNNLVQSRKKLKISEDYLKNLEHAYEKAKETGNANETVRLARSIEAVKATLNNNEKQQELLGEYLYEATKKLREFSEHLAGTAIPAYPLAKAAAKVGIKGEVLASDVQVAAAKKIVDAIKKKDVKLTSEEIQKIIDEHIGQAQLAKTFGLPQPPLSDLTQNLNQALDAKKAADQARRNRPLRQKLADFSKSATKASAKNTYQFGKNKANEGASYAYQTAKRPVIATRNVIASPYFATRGVYRTGKSAVNSTKNTYNTIKQQGVGKSAVLGTKAVGRAVGTQALEGTAQILAPAINLVRNIKNIVKTIKNIIKAIRIATTSATVLGAVANLALLAKDKLRKLARLVLKAIAAIEALMAILFLMFLAKILGFISGIAVGLVTGAPLLLIPGAGPFLYAGYVSYWAWRGWTDPIGTIQLATHPWEIYTRPINWIKNQFSNFGSATKGGIESAAFTTGNAATGVFYGAANFVTGVASAVWGGITGALGGAASFAASAAGSIWGAFSQAGSAIIGNTLQVAVGGSLAGVATATVMGTMITNSAFYTQDLDPKEQFFPPGQNELFSIRKTANPTSISTPDILSTTPVTFTVSVTANSQNLINLQINDSTSTSNGSTLLTAANTCTQANLPQNIAAGSTWTCTIVINVNNSQDAANVNNTVTLTATSQDGTKTKTDSASAIVRVGNAPQGCPSGWPVQSGSISQGPRGATSHYRLYPAEEAIDIAYPTVFGTDTFTTFTGIVEDVHGDNDNGYGKYVDIRGVCNGSEFIARWAHLDFIDGNFPQVKSTVNSGTYIGDVDSTGHVTGPHLHYSFFGLQMVAPYIPNSLSDIFCNGESACNLSW